MGSEKRYGEDDLLFYPEWQEQVLLSTELHKSHLQAPKWGT